MRMIGSRTHGYLDYLVSLLLILAPFIFGFNYGGAEMWVPIIVGGGLLIVSLITDYELSMTKAVSLKTHLNLDILMGIFLAASPWLFGFADIVYLPHLLVGIAEIGAGLMTRTVPDYRYEVRH